jgi:DNA helicase-4
VSKIEKQFLNLAYRFYKSYLRCLEDRGEEDFDGLMQKAVEVLASGQTIFSRRLGTGDLKSLRYIMIDEYQDFSELFYNLIAAIRKQNPQALFFCVGDDWQSINGFAGSDLRFYQNFHQFFQPSQQLNISTNYRSAYSIVGIGNKLMQGLGTPARAHKTMSGIVNIADMSSFEPTPTEQENYPGDNITPAILRLINKTIKEGKKVVLLSRKNSLLWYVNYKNKALLILGMKMILHTFNILVETFHGTSLPPKIIRQFSNARLITNELGSTNCIVYGVVLMLFALNFIL